MIADNVLYATVDSPIGSLLLSSDSDGAVLTGLYIESQKYEPTRDDRWRRDDAPFRDAIRQLAAYFAGDLHQFDLPIEFQGTDFQRRVWEALRAIPFGETITYAELAVRVGSAGSARAVGAAVGRNPMSIIVPCHRVVGSSGSLTGYAGGLDRKRWLLQHERPVPAPSERFALTSEQC